MPRGSLSIGKRQMRGAQFSEQDGPSRTLRNSETRARWARERTKRASSRDWNRCAPERALTPSLIVEMSREPACRANADSQRIVATDDPGPSRRR